MKRFVIAIMIIGTIAIAWVLRNGVTLPNKRPQPAPTPTPDERIDSFVASDACRRCHEKQYDTWHDTWHRTMTQKASPESILGDFEDVSLSAYGRDYHLQHSGEEYLVTMVAPEWETSLLLDQRDPNLVPNPPIVTRPIVQTTGSHRMQTYWVEAEDGLRQVPWFFHIEEQMWIAAEDSFLSAPSNGRMFSIWNMQCIKCHATGGQPRMNQFNGHFESEVPELGIACEACHGAGQDHIAFHSDESIGAAENRVDPVFNPGKSDHVAGSQVCGQCHSSSVWHDMQDWMRLGSKYQPGMDFTEFAEYELPGDHPSEEEAPYLSQGYWQDGTCRVGGDELMGMMKSKCYLEGDMGCTSCHSMHDSDPVDQLREGMRSNDACYQCHDEYRDTLQKHTHHVPGSSGSLCYNCHMPYTSYALMQALRSHRIDSPTAELVRTSDRPNACNLCHLDRSLDWAYQSLLSWDQPELKSLQDGNSRDPAVVTWLLEGNAMQRVIAAWALGWDPARKASIEDWQAPFLAGTLTDPYAAIRFVAWRSLKKYPGLSDIEFSFSEDESERIDQRDAAISRIKALHPSVPTLHRRTILSASDYDELLKFISMAQKLQDDTPMHIPE